MCDGTPARLGALGKANWFRCTSCGWQFSTMTSPTRVTEAEQRELAAIRAHHNEEYDAGLDDVDGRFPVEEA